MELLPIAQAFFGQYAQPHAHPPIEADQWARIDRTNTSAVLEKRHRDIAYAATMQGGRKLLACPEQQSTPDITILTRLLHYSAEDLAPYLKASQQLPLLCNILFYSGEVSPYPYPNTLEAYYAELAPGSQDLSLRFRLIDVTQIADEELVTHGHCAPMELLLKHGRDGIFALEVAAYRDVFQGCIDAVGDDYIATMLDYATSLSNEAAGARMYHFLEKVLINKEDTIMTYGERLQQQGMQQGMQQGIERVAQNMLSQLHLGIEEVKKATGLSREALEQLQAAR